MAKKFYQVIRNGEIIATRKSDRDYSHAYVLFFNTRWVGKGQDCRKEQVTEYHSPRVGYARTAELAAKAGAREAKFRDALRFEIIPVTVQG